GDHVPGLHGDLRGPALPGLPAVGLLAGGQRPSLEALTQRLVDRDEMPEAAAIGTLRFNIGEIGGPALGGVLIAVVGLPLTYAFDVATFAASLLLLRMMRAAPPPVAGAKVS